MSKHPHYAWFICLGGGLSFLCVMGLGMNIYALYQPYIIAENNFTNTQGSLIITVRSLSSLITTLVIGRIIPKIGLRLTVTSGIIIQALSCFVFALATNFSLYCAGAALLGISFTMGSTVPMAILISKWFQDRMGLAMGLATAASGISTIILPPILLPIIQHRGLSAAFTLEGIGILVIAAVIFLLLRNDPADMGLKPYQAAHHTDSAPAPVANDQGKDTPRLTLPVLGLILFSTALISGPAGGGFAHLPILFTSEGFDETAVALFMSYTGLALLVIKIVYGQVVDSVGGFLSNFVTGGFFALGGILCCFAPLQKISLSLLAITFSCCGFAFTSVTQAVWCKDFSGRFEYAQLLRWTTTAYMVGCLVTGPLPGMIADYFGSYVPVYAFFSGVVLLAYGMIQCIYLYLGIAKRPKTPTQVS